MDEDAATTPESSVAGSVHAAQRRGSIARLKRNDLQCSLCRRLFSKPEHLKRHEQSHAGLRQFLCRSCNKTFGRQDSLKRHERTHAVQLEQATLIGTVNHADRPMNHGFGGGNDHLGLLALAQATTAHESDNMRDARAHQDFDSFANPELQPSTFQMPMQHSVAQRHHSVDESPMFHTPWAGSDDLLHMLLNEDTAWPIDFQMPIPDTHGDNTESGSRQEAADGITSSFRAQQAMTQMSNLIQDLSFNLAKEVQSTGVTSDFLDTCLNTFFDRFVPILPVCHQPTFSLKNCAHPLLLNMIALGSLFVATDDAVDRGEALWRLAHTAVATSWQGMMNHLTQGDVTTGVQLVMTALLGQSYAVLSRNRSSRLTSHIFHSLGFYWARQCGMPVTVPFTDVPNHNSPDDVKRSKWKIWAAQETRHRALLGHYILDGLISQSSGLPTSDRHLTNSMILPSSAKAYEATTADAWIEAMQQTPQSLTTFREVYLQLFETQDNMQVHLSPFTIRVVLEGFQSLISDRHEAKGRSVGVPDENAISRAMWRLMSLQINRYSNDQLVDLSLRWHVINIELCIDTNLLIRHLCYLHGIQQDVCSGGSMARTFSIEQWVMSGAARRALLHATAVLDLVTSLPFDRMQAIHIPLAVFTSSAVFLALCLAGRSKASMPSAIDWSQVCDMGHEALRLSQRPSATIAFLDPSNDVWSARNATRGFLYSVNTLQTVLGSLSSTWGIAKEMGSIVAQLLPACRTHLASNA